MMTSWMWGGWPFIGLGLLIIGLLIVAGSYLLLTDSRPVQPRNRVDALDLAKQRFAQGDISLEEYQQIKRNL